MSDLLEVKNLKKRFGAGDARVDVLKGIDLQVSQGETIALVGPSGAGKSTLLHILGTLDRPSEGSYNFCGEDVFTLGERALADFRNRTMGFVFQFHHLLPEFSALENVMMPLLIAGKGRKESMTAALSILDDVGLGHRSSHRPGELSGGEQQRVAIARGLVGSPRVLLADEPTGNLDMKTSDGIHSLLIDIHKSMGLTLMIVTHNERLAALMERTVRLEDGRIFNN